MKAHRFTWLLVAALGGALLFPGAADAIDGSEHSSLYYEQQQSMEELSQLSGEEFEQGYINRVIPHHEGALDMAQIMVYKAPNQDTRDLSEMAIKTQAEEINQLATWQQQWYGQPVSPNPAFVLPDSIPQSLEADSPEVAEAAFLLMFREHHQSVIEMSEMLLEREELPHYDELAPMARMVIEGQNEQQQMMADYAQEFYGIEAPTPVTGDIPLGRQLALQQLEQATAEGEALPDTGGVELAPRAGLTLPLSGLGLLAAGAGVYALRRRFD